MKNIIFIGGIHGSGKNFLIDTAMKKTNLPIIHLSASKLINWKSQAKPENKKVSSVIQNQELLTQNLKTVINKSNKYLLDGHFVLLNTRNEIVKIPEQTFIDINPKAIILKVASPDAIIQRLNNRDNVNWDINDIKKFQNIELDHAFQISKNLKVPFYVLKDNEDEMMINILQYELFNNKTMPQINVHNRQKD